jgi:hypothetical protein
MKKIDYTRIIPQFVGPKLAYHGFRYDKLDSFPPEGDFSFTRTYWGKSQRVGIGPVQYDLEAMEVVTLQGSDCPTEVPQHLLRLQEPGFRMWLSNKYIIANLEHEGGGITLFPDTSISQITEPFDSQELIKKLKAGPLPLPGAKLPFFWEFRGEVGLRRVLSEIIRIIVPDGLDWFDQKTDDVRRHQEKLQRRRETAKKQS